MQQLPARVAGFGKVVHKGTNDEDLSNPIHQEMKELEELRDTASLHRTFLDKLIALKNMMLGHSRLDMRYRGM